MAVSTTIAVVFDFDDTLVPDSTTMLLKEHGIDPDKFWKHDAKALVTRGYDPTLAWLRLLLDAVGPDAPLGLLTNERLHEFGASLDAHFHAGLPALFDELKAMVQEYRIITVEFYIVSGGLQAVIEGSVIVQKYFAGVYGCTLDEAGEPLTIRHVKRAINFTEKTRYLFEINKGLTPKQTQENPYLVNREIPKAKRRVPFRNMIYVGDGLTDIPCFSLLTRFGGTCFGVFDPTDHAKAKRALLEFLKPRRVIGMHSPKYGQNDDLGSLLRAAVSSLSTRIVVDQQTAEFTSDENG
jgi:phosphoglycolate phosphatase-like HAD superfamily hydrolase